jgi:hypothetical protein
MKRRPYRQGDICLVPAKKLPKNAKLHTSAKRITIAEGETTGHAHVMVGERMELYTVESPTAEAAQQFLNLERTTTFVHEEHATVTVPPGVYEVRRQKEYSPLATRTVFD